MFGLLYQSLERMLIRRFGQEIWDEIKEMIELNEKDITTEYTFGIHTMYDDKYALDLVAAASEVLGIKQDLILELFGEQFIQFCHEAGYGKILTCLAPNLKDFLATLDTLHEHLTDTYPGMKPPSFTCSENESGLIVTYYSSRMGLESVVVGIIKSIARDIFNQEVILDVHHKLRPNEPARFTVREATKMKPSNHFLTTFPSTYSPPVTKENLIPSEIFASIFPFHFVFNSDLSVLQTGQALTRIFTNALVQDIPDYKADQLFSILKPKIQFKFQEVYMHTHTVFILQVQTAIKMRNDHITSAKFSFRLKGQMIYLPNIKALLFLGSPRVTSLEEIQTRGLYLSDFPIHDATRDLLMMMECCRAEMAMAIKMELLTENLRETKMRLEEEKSRSERLLHQMLPRSVAQQLMTGRPVTAERFESVTILFSDIKHFVKMVGNADPIEVVNMLNELYVKFDQATAQHNVYKVETIGDAYMIVGGLPNRIKNHAEEVSKMAIDMMNAASTVRAITTEDDRKGEEQFLPVKIRIGMHCGPVVAGVVGKKMPRYCLFGQTVNIASRTESNGEVDRIHITEDVYRELESNPLFSMVERGHVEFKGLEEGKMCYWLEAKRYRTLDNELVTPFMINVVNNDIPDVPFPGPGYRESLPLSPSMTSTNTSHKISKESQESNLFSPHRLRASNSLLNLVDDRSASPFLLASPTPSGSGPRYLIKSNSIPNLPGMKIQSTKFGFKQTRRPSRNAYVECGYINRGSGVFQPIQLKDSQESQL